MLSILDRLDRMIAPDRPALHAALASAVTASVGAAAAKQGLGRVLRAADAGPIAITRNGTIESYLVSARWLEGGPRPLAPRPGAGARQAFVEARAAETRRDDLRRQRLARLLRAKGPATRRAARARLDQWEREGMVAADVIREWREILGLPAGKAAARACADSPRARLLRKSSPFIGLAV